jgi:hypothetical protein
MFFTGVDDSPTEPYLLVAFVRYRVILTYIFLAGEVGWANGLQILFGSLRIINTQLLSLALTMIPNRCLTLLTCSLTTYTALRYRESPIPVHLARILPTLNICAKVLWPVVSRDTELSDNLCSNIPKCPPIPMNLKAMISQTQTCLPQLLVSCYQKPPIQQIIKSLCPKPDS